MGTEARARGATRVLVAAMSILALVGVALVLWPLVPVLVAAAWMAHVARPLQRWLTAAFHGRSSAGAVVTAGVLLVPLAPIAIAAPLLASEASAIGAALRSGSVSTDRIRAVAGLEGPDLVQRFRSHAFESAGTIFSTSAVVLVQVLMFIAALYAFLVWEDEVARWTRRHVPLDDAIVDRLARAFHETGRGVFCGIAVTALVQAVVAGFVFTAFGIPGAFGLALLTCFASLVPIVGTALVWAPVAIGLFMSGAPSKAIALAITCAIFVGGIDNVLKPLLSRWARLELPATVLLVAMLSGILAMGPWGLLLGPLIVRMAFEMLAIARELGVFRRDDSLLEVPAAAESGAQPVAMPRPSRALRAVTGSGTGPRATHS